MPGLDRSPLPARELSAVASLLDRPIVAVDVGSRDGVRESWRALGSNALLVGFDPDPQECARPARAPGTASDTKRSRSARAQVRQR